MIGQSKDMNTGRYGVSYQLCRPVVTIGGGGVSVEVDDCWHASMLGARLERWPSLPHQNPGRIAPPPPSQKLSATLSRPDGVLPIRPFHTLSSTLASWHRDERGSVQNSPG